MERKLVSETLKDSLDNKLFTIGWTIEFLLVHKHLMAEICVCRKSL